MSQVRPGSRRPATEPLREVQGVLAMHHDGSESGTETTERGQGTFLAEPPKPTPTPDGAARATTTTTTTTHRGRRRRSESGPSEVRPLPYRAVLAAWPDGWRERWGRRANELEDLGMSWRDAEGRAFLEVWNDWRATADVVDRN